MIRYNEFFLCAQTLDIMTKSIFVIDSLIMTYLPFANMNMKGTKKAGQ